MNTKNIPTKRESLIASFERKIENRKKKITRIKDEYKLTIENEKEELEILEIQLKALNK